MSFVLVYTLISSVGYSCVIVCHLYVLVCHPYAHIDKQASKQASKQEPNKSKSNTKIQIKVKIITKMKAQKLQFALTSLYDSQ